MLYPIFEVAKEMSRLVCVLFLSSPTSSLIYSILSYGAYNFIDRLGE